MVRVRRWMSNCLSWLCGWLPGSQTAHWSFLPPSSRQPIETGMSTHSPCSYLGLLQQPEKLIYPFHVAFKLGLLMSKGSWLPSFWLAPVSHVGWANHASQPAGDGMLEHLLPMLRASFPGLWPEQLLRRGYACFLIMFLSGNDHDSVETDDTEEKRKKSNPWSLPLSVLPCPSKAKGGKCW